MTNTGGLYYIHERIDQLVRQTALEIVLLRLEAGADPGDTLAIKDRFWAAQDAAADNHNQERRVDH